MWKSRWPSRELDGPISAVAFCPLVNLVRSAICQIQLEPRRCIGNRNHCDSPLVVRSKVTSAEDNKNRGSWQLTERRWTLRLLSRRTRQKNGPRSFPPRSTRTARPERPLENARRTLVSTIDMSPALAAPGVTFGERRRGHRPLVSRCLVRERPYHQTCGTFLLLGVYTGISADTFYNLKVPAGVSLSLLFKWDYDIIYR